MDGNSNFHAASFNDEIGGQCLNAKRWPSLKKTEPKANHFVCKIDMRSQSENRAAFQNSIALEFGEEVCGCHFDLIRSRIEFRNSKVPPI